MIIGNSWALLATRMHASIAAFSMGVPSIVVSYNHKTHGIIGEQIDLPELLIDIKNISGKEFKKQLYSKWEYVTDNYTALQEKIFIKVQEAKKASATNMELIKKYV